MTKVNANFTTHLFALLTASEYFTLKIILNLKSLSFLLYKGDWHQYDDIVCAEPSKNILKRWTDTIKDTLWRDQKRDLIQGRNIAGKIMLETIFDLLRSWTVTNLKNFLIQLKQFFQVYSDPFVYEDKERKWFYDYGEEDVSLYHRFLYISITLCLAKCRK